MKSTAFLTIIMAINWIFEIISFYNETSSTFFDIINALQGVLIFLVFVCMPKPLALIRQWLRQWLRQWYKDRGSFEVGPESQALYDEIQALPGKNQALTDESTEKSPDIQMTSLCKQ